MVESCLLDDVGISENQNKELARVIYPKKHVNVGLALFLFPKFTEVENIIAVSSLSEVHRMNFMDKIMCIFK